jgi:hypothetical protein
MLMCRFGLYACLAKNVRNPAEKERTRREFAYSFVYLVTEWSSADNNR